MLHNTAATLFWVIFKINENRFPIVPAVSKGIKSEYKEELAKVVSTFTSLLSLSSPDHLDPSRANYKAPGRDFHPVGSI